MIRTSRTVLREVEETDLQLMVEWRNAPENKKHFFTDITLTLDIQKKWFKKIRENVAQKFFVIDFDGKPIGTIALNKIDLRVGRAEIGNVLIGDRSKRRQGIAKEAVISLINYAFHLLNLTKIYVEVFADNKSAVKLYESCGFVYQEIYQNDHKKEIKIMSVLKP